MASRFDLRRRVRDLVEAGPGIGVMVAALATPWRRGQRSRWGTGAVEAGRVYPGDDLVARPSWQWTHSIEVDAPPDAVWPWVAQVGADRGGFYSYAALENLVGCRITNADRIHPEWAVGPDSELLIHPKAPPLPVAAMEPGAWFVAHGGPPPGTDPADGRWVDVSWLFLVEPTGDGSRSRVVSRYRCATSSDRATRLQFGPALVEPISFAMDRRMLFGIRHRAEQATWSGPGPRGASRTRDRGLVAAFHDRVAAADLGTGPGDEAPITEADVAGLDEPVERYLRFMGVIGRPRAWSFTARFAGRFRLHPRIPWLAAEALQYDSLLPGPDGRDRAARVFTMRLRFARVVSMLGHDTYLDGRGRMVGTLAGRVRVVDGSGPEFDVGELSTWLNDVLLLAPSMLLRTDVTWRALDSDRFEVTLTDSGHTVRAQVTIDGQGAPLDLATTDRWAALPGGLVQARWHTPIPFWIEVDGRPFPGPGPAVWDLPDGPLTYVDGRFVPGSAVVNVRPPT